MAWSPQKIVVPIDFSDESVKALDYALQLADDLSQVLVIHVVPDVTDYAAGLLLSSITDESRISHARLALRERLTGPNYEAIELDARVGDAGTEIAAFAEDRGADLIVIPSHGRKGISRWLIGSVAERVVRSAHCPVLILKDIPQANKLLRNGQHEATASARHL